jgi:opacity protein-like surface antigen
MLAELFRTRLLVLIGTAALGVTSASAQQPLPPPPRPWTSEGNTSTTASAPLTEANGSRIRVTPEAVAQADQKNQPAFKAEPPLRGSVGSWYIGVMAGANVTQDDDLSGPAGRTSGSAQPMGGLKFGYVYPFDREPIDQFMDETHGRGIRLAGALETEAFYLRNETNVNAAAGSRELVTDNAYFMLNALLKGAIGRLGLYAGPGGGVAYTHASGNAVAGGKKDDVNLAYQFMGGIEYSLSSDWSLFAEYKYLVNDGLTLDLFSANKAKFGSLEQNVFMLGLKKGF